MKRKKIRITVKTDRELVDFVLNQLPNLFDSVPRAAASRTAVEKFVKELKERL